MNTVIVPVDFSDASLNAANYAAQLFTGHESVNMILYHIYEKPWESAGAGERLGQLKNEFAEKYSFNVTCHAEQGTDFIGELEKLVRHRRVDLIIMGGIGQSSLSQVFMGTNTLKMAETKACPVLIVPQNSPYHEIKNVMLASDFKNVISTTPSVPIIDFLKTFKSNLSIVNVNSEHYVAINESYEKQKQDMESMFSEFDPEFYFLRLYDVDDALSQFATDKNIDLIITIQRQHSVLYRRFRSSHIKNLANHSNVPVLVVHE